MVKLKRLGRNMLGFTYPKKQIFTTTWGRATPVVLPPCPPDVPFLNKPDIAEGLSENVSVEDLTAIQATMNKFYDEAEAQHGRLLDMATDIHRTAADFTMDVDQWAYLALEVDILVFDQLSIYTFFNLFCFGS